MQPRTKIIVLSCVLLLLYMAFVVFFAVRSEEHPLPTWFPYFGMSYILGSVLLVGIVSRRIYRGTPSETAQEPSLTGGAWARGWMARLVLFWSALFLWGAYRTLTGHLDWHRSLPAGAFLLAFIVLFAWALYRGFKPKGESSTKDDDRDSNGS